MSNRYGLGVVVCVYEVTGDDSVASVWQTDHPSSAALIEEFTTRWGQPIGEATAPFPNDDGQPETVVMIYD